MSTLELAALIGREVNVPLHPRLWVRCRVTDAKCAWGRDRIQVTPVAGEGSLWVERWQEV